jgi:hypothetical protein
LQDPPKFTQILIFGLKTYHLATLDSYRKKNLLRLHKTGLSGLFLGRINRSLSSAGRPD